MSWIEEQQREQNEQDYLSYKITQELVGRMTPSLEGIIRSIKTKGYNHEKVQSKKRKSASCGTHDSVGTCTDSDTGTRESLHRWNGGALDESMRKDY